MSDDFNSIRGLLLGLVIGIVLWALLAWVAFA